MLSDRLGLGRLVVLPSCWLLSLCRLSLSWGVEKREIIASGRPEAEIGLDSFSKGLLTPSLLLFLFSIFDFSTCPYFFLFAFGFLLSSRQVWHVVRIRPLPEKRQKWELQS